MYRLSGKLIVSVPWDIAMTLDRECKRYNISRAAYLHDILLDWWKIHDVPLEEDSRPSPTKDSLSVEDDEESS